MWRKMRAVLTAVGLSGVVTMGTGCDSGGDIADTIFFAFRIVDVWV